MKLIMKYFAQSLIVAGLLPAVMISAITNAYGTRENKPAVANKDTFQHEISVINEDGTYSTLELEEYVVGVVLGEVSSDFYPEALKAQAVATRTYTLYCTEVLKKHTIGAVCTDYHCCQAYCNPENYLANETSAMELKDVIDAVQATKGEVLYHDNNLICATYFASSGGQTEDALEVWGTFYPYLQPVESPGEESCGYYRKVVTFTPDELTDALSVELTGSPTSWFGMVKYTAGRGIDLMRIGGRLYTGVELRRLLKLRSTMIYITASETEITVETTGYGHRVGMSQHGANAMAQKGEFYFDILKHYYRGVTILPYNLESHAFSTEND